MKASNNEFARILEVLNTMKPLSPDAMLTSFDRLIARIAFWLLWIGAGLFLVLVAFAAWVRFVDGVKQHGRSATTILAGRRV